MNDFKWGVQSVVHMSSSYKRERGEGRREGGGGKEREEGKRERCGMYGWKREVT